MKKLTLALLVTVLAAGIVHARVAGTIGIVPIFGKTTTNVVVKNAEVSLNDDLGVSRNMTAWEGWLGVYTGNCNVRGYYLFPKTTSATSPLPASLKDKNAKTDIQVTTDFEIKMGRVEVGIPLFNDRHWFLEPFFIYQNICPTVTVQGKDLSASSSWNASLAGAGINFVERITVTTVLNAKFFITPSSSQFDANLCMVRNNMFLGVGYTNRVVNLDRINMRLSGPQIEIGVVF